MIPVFGSKVGSDELREIEDCLERQWLGLGPKTAAFEQAFAKHLGVLDTVVVNSGSNALFAAVSLLDLPPAAM